MSTIQETVAAPAGKSLSATAMRTRIGGQPAEITYEDLLEASKKCKRNVAWKSSTQMYTMNRLMWAASMKRKLDDGTYRPKKYNEFKIHERGKLREIHSFHISDRVVQKAFNEKILKPKTYPGLINRNCASQPGKGTKAQIDGLKEDLRRHYRKHGRNGYILLIDFTNYFGNIDKEILIGKLNLQPDEEKLLRQFTNDCDGLGLGSEINQTGAIFYASSLDHFTKERLRIKGYGRYMDDIYLIHEDKKYLEYCREEIFKECEKLKIKINPKKVKLIRLTDQFTFLKKRIRLTDTGKIIMRPTKDNFKRRRKNLKTQKKLLSEGKMTMDQVETSYKTWRNYAIQNGAPRKSIKSMDELYQELFRKEIECQTKQKSKGITPP